MSGDYCYTKKGDLIIVIIGESMDISPGGRMLSHTATEHAANSRGGGGGGERIHAHDLLQLAID